MDLNRANIYLNKITRLYNNLKESQTSVSAIEKKLMLDYISNLYDAVLEEAPAPQQTYQAPKPIPQVTLPPRRETVQAPAPKVTYQQTAPEPTPKPIPQKVFQEPVVVPRASPEPQKPKVYVFEQPKRETPRPAAVPQKSTNSDYDELFEIVFSNDLSDKLSSKPIKDIKRSMGINERFLTINELFKGNSSKFETVVNTLNGLSNYADARQYLESNVVDELEWMDNKRLKMAKRFVKLVYRRFL